MLVLKRSLSVQGTKKRHILIWVRKDFPVLFELMSAIAPNLAAVPTGKLKGVFKPA